MRRAPRRRFGRRPTLYALTLAPDRRVRWGRRGAVLAALLLALAGVAAVAEATSNDPPGPPVRPSNLAKRPAQGPRPGARRPQHSAITMAPAVARVLRYTPLIAGGATRRQAIALTFDDGPGPYTSQIVRVLSRLHAPATFFVVGQQLSRFASALRDEVRHGFEIGDHTQNHAWLPRLDSRGQYTQVNATAEAVQRLGAPRPLLFRPPYGMFDRRTLAVLRNLHMLAVLWSVDPGDWRRPGAAAIVRSVLSAARPGAVVEMHDGGGDRSQTVAALPAIVKGLRRRHFRLVTVGQLLALDPPPRHQRLPRVTAP